MTLNYALMYRLPDGTKMEEQVDHATELNRKAQEHIRAGRIVLGYSYADMDTPSGRRVHRSGTRAFGKELR